MTYETEPKPLVDAVNDAIAALSDLLRTLRAHKGKRAGAKPSARSAKRRVKLTARAVVTKGKKAARTARQAGVAFVKGAESALRDIAEQAEEQRTHDRPGDGSRSAGHASRYPE